MPPVRRPRELRLQWRRPRTHPGRTASGDSSSVENISRPGLRSNEPPGFRGHAGICQFHTADHGVNGREVHPRGFGGAAGFCVFQLWVQEATAAPAPALATTHPDSVAESFLSIGNVIVRRKDTSRASVQSVEQVLNPCHLLPSTLGEERVLEAPERSPISES